MVRKLSVVLAVSVLWAAICCPAWSDERRLTAAEIERQLAGNTIEGAWKGTPYRQFFDRNGMTIYLAEGAPPSQGKWRAQASTDQYCSQWGPGAWACYDLLSGDPGTVVWRVPSDGYLSPAKVLEGRQLY